MVDVDGLEEVSEWCEARQSAVSECPVGQQLYEFREDAVVLGTHGGVGVDECRDEHVSTVFVDGSVLRVELFSGMRCPLRIGGVGVSVFDLLLYSVDLVAELQERVGLV